MNDSLVFGNFKMKANNTQIKLHHDCDLQFVIVFKVQSSKLNYSKNTQLRPFKLKEALWGKATGR